VPRRRDGAMGAGDVPCAFADATGEVWRSVEATEKWLRSNGVYFSIVAARLLKAGPATRLLTAQRAWRQQSGFAGAWPHKYPGLLQRSLIERLQQPSK